MTKSQKAAGWIGIIVTVLLVAAYFGDGKEVPCAMRNFGSNTNQIVVGGVVSKETKISFIYSSKFAHGAGGAGGVYVTRKIEIEAFDASGVKLWEQEVHCETDKQKFERQTFDGKVAKYDITLWGD